MKLERSWFDFVVWGLYSSDKTANKEVDIDVVGNKQFITFVRHMFEERYKDAPVIGQVVSWDVITKVKVPLVGTFTFIEDNSKHGFQFNIKNEQV